MALVNFQILSSMSKDELTSLCGPLLADALSTWDFLLLRVNLMKDDNKGEVDALLHELAVLLEKLTKIAEDLLFPVFTKETEKDNDYVEVCEIMLSHYDTERMDRRLANLELI